MKKILTVFLSLSILIIFTTNSFAQTGSSPNIQSFTGAVASLNDIKYIKDNGQEKVTIYTANYKGYKFFYVPNPDRYVIDIPNTILDKGYQTVNINSSLVKSVRYSQYTTSSVRVVLDVVGKPQYQIQENNGSLSVALGKPVSNDGTKVTRPSEPSRGDYDRSPKQTLGIDYSTSGSGDKVILSAKNYKGYNIMRLTGPDRIVVDIPNTSAPSDQQVIKVGSNLIKDIRYAQLDNNNTARVVLDTSGQVQYQVKEGQGQLTLSVNNSGYKNITYSNNGDRVYFSLKGAKLTDKPDASQKFYKGSYDATGKKYTVTFPGNLADLGSGIMQINDGMLDSVEIKNDAPSHNTSITFNAKGKFVYEVITRPDVNDTAITVLKPYTKADKLVVIDAGHGGKEVGAVYGNVQEKNLNLDIALKLNDILRSKGIKTYMTREDDSYVALYERAHIANDLNAALFLCVHNNAFYSSENGTETLYYPNAKSKSFAQIVQNSLISYLGTKNRGIVERPGLVVLKATEMPATLAEVAFITNSGDRSKLLDEGFRQKAASALSDAVIKALNQIP